MRRRGFMEQIPLSVGLPAEPAPGKPLIELIDDRRVLIENHRGITAYGCHEIQVNVSFGAVVVCGSGLQIVQMTQQQLVIIGCIDAITIKRR